MYPAAKIEAFTQTLLNLIGENWPWADPKTSPILDHSTAGFIAYSDGGKSIIVPTNFYDCPLAIASHTKVLHIYNAEQDGQNPDDYLKETPLFFKFHIMFLSPTGNAIKYVDVPTIITQAYCSFDEYGRDKNRDLIGFGKNPDMTTKGRELTIPVDSFNPEEIARDLFDFTANHPPAPLTPQPAQTPCRNN